MLLSLFNSLKSTLSDRFIHSPKYAQLRALFNFPATLASRKKQAEYIRTEQLASKKRISVFFIPHPLGVTGGDMQIFTLQRILREHYKNSDEACVICWFPIDGAGVGICENNLFKNDAIILSLDLLLESINKDCELFFYLPEFRSVQILEGIGWDKVALLRDRHGLNANILNQNIESMISPADIKKIQEVLPHITSTAGNPIWANAEERERLGLPIHVIPTWYYPDEAARKPYETKKNLLIVSRDEHPAKANILKLIQDALPDLEVVIINNISYETYLNYERAAKWSITFGEGCDGYFYGPVLRGAISFAERNGTFDVLNLDEIATTYSSYEEMANKIVADMQRLDNKESYEEYNQYLRKPLAAFMGYDNTVNALMDYVKGNYTFP